MFEGSRFCKQPICPQVPQLVVKRLIFSAYLGDCPASPAYTEPPYIFFGWPPICLIAIWLDTGCPFLKSSSLPPPLWRSKEPVWCLGTQ